jgi:hypothetical protein
MNFDLTEIARESVRAGGGARDWSNDFSEGIYRRHRFAGRVVRLRDLWAACIGGAAEQQNYRSAIETAGVTVERLEENAEYRFISDRARKATAKWGVKSVSILARKP